METGATPVLRVWFGSLGVVPTASFQLKQGANERAVNTRTFNGASPPQKLRGARGHGRRENLLDNNFSLYHSRFMKQDRLQSGPFIIC